MNKWITFLIKKRLGLVALSFIAGTFLYSMEQQNSNPHDSWDQYPSEYSDWQQSPNYNNWQQDPQHNNWQQNQSSYYYQWDETQQYPHTNTQGQHQYYPLNQNSQQTQQTHSPLYGPVPLNPKNPYGRIPLNKNNQTEQTAIPQHESHYSTLIDNSYQEESPYVDISKMSTNDNPYEIMPEVATKRQPNENRHYNNLPEKSSQQTKPVNAFTIYTLPSFSSHQPVRGKLPIPKTNPLNNTTQKNQFSEQSFASNRSNQQEKDLLISYAILNNTNSPMTYRLVDDHDPYQNIIFQITIANNQKHMIMVSHNLSLIGKNTNKPVQLEMQILREKPLSSMSVQLDDEALKKLLTPNALVSIFNDAIFIHQSDDESTPLVLHLKPVKK